MAHVTWLGHATVLAALGRARILTDPVLRPRVAHLLRQAPAPALPGRLDAVLVSHMHYDHADVPTLRRIGAGVPLIAPRGAASVLRRLRADVLEVAVGDVVAVGGGATVRAVPARHDGRRRPGAARLDALGFVLEGGGRRIYFAGDTDLFSGMQTIGDAGLDLALLPVWGWGPTLGPGHLDPERAARAAALLRPRIAVPIHHGTYLPAGLGRRHRDLLDAPATAFAALAREHAPEVQVRRLAPGASLDL
jgi:L-ascorbate metabolism protein UlaG (beta-lactamase superfamily)